MENKEKPLPPVPNKVHPTVQQFLNAIGTLMHAIVYKQADSGSFDWCLPTGEEFRITVSPRGGARGIDTFIPREEWKEEDGEVLWWKLPVEEAPYVGNPLCGDWPGYHTHFTYIQMPDQKQEVTKQ